MRIKLLIIPALIFSQNLFGQVLLNPQEAVQLALQNNLQLNAARNLQEAAEIQKTYGNAGFLPNLQLNGAYTLQSIDLKQEFSNGLLVDRRGVGSTNLQAGLGLQWALFDGGRMFYNWNRLGEEARKVGFDFRAQAEQCVASTLLAYYNIVQLQQQLFAVEAGLETANQQVLVCDTRWHAGTGSRQELLQAEIDRNTWKALLIQQKSLIRTAKIQLNELLSRAPDIEFTVSDTIPSFYQDRIAGEDDTDFSKNTLLQQAEINRRLAGLATKTTHSQLLPMLQLNAGYQFGQNSSEGGFALFNRSIGPSAGLNLSWNLFSGGQITNAVRRAKITQSNADLNFRSVELAVSAQLRVCRLQLEDQKSIKTLEEQNMVAAQENMQLALERFQAGKTDMLSLKEAQRSFQEGISRQSNATLAVLKAEIELLRIKGTLIR